jgi:hypothetical protein
MVEIHQRDLVAMDVRFRKEIDTYYFRASLDAFNSGHGRDALFQTIVQHITEETAHDLLELAVESSRFPLAPALLTGVFPPGIIFSSAALVGDFLAGEAVFAGEAFFAGEPFFVTLPVCTPSPLASCAFADGASFLNEARILRLRVSSSATAALVFLVLDVGVLGLAFAGVVAVFAMAVVLEKNGSVDRERCCERRCARHVNNEVWGVVLLCN